MHDSAHLAANQHPTAKRLALPLLGAVGWIFQFKPPFGPYIAIQAYRRLRRKSILEDAASFFPKGRSRSLDLDTADVEYALAGGVDAVRLERYRALVAAELAAVAETTAGAEDQGAAVSRAAVAMEGEAARVAYLRVLQNGLALSCPQNGQARADFVAASAESLAHTAALRRKATAAKGWIQPGAAAAMREAELLLELRAADALLR